jgi:hypothetical protein
MNNRTLLIGRCSSVLAAGISEIEVSMTAFAKDMGRRLDEDRIADIDAQRLDFREPKAEPPVPHLHRNRPRNDHPKRYRRR